jgi:hypothetical protein
MTCCYSATIVTTGRRVGRQQRRCEEACVRRRGRQTARGQGSCGGVQQIEACGVERMVFLDRRGGRDADMGDLIYNDLIVAVVNYLQRLKINSGR